MTLVQICVRRFQTLPNIWDLNNHIIDKHKEKQFPCNQCDKVFGFEKGIKKHLKDMHSRNIVEKAEKCEQCNKTFIQLDKHIARIHEKSIK